MQKSRQILMIYLFLAIASLVVFWQVNNFEFIFYDDPFYVTENYHVQNGLTLDNIRWAFTTNHVANWHPLTWISHMLDVQLFGLNPRWHHVTNLLFHIANTLLLFFVLHRITKAHWQSAAVAALFALHPLHVESVAWVAERKDVLSTFFWMLTMGAYCWYVERPGLPRYAVIVLFFAFGLLSKPMLVTLPFVLLLLDYWPLRRFPQSGPHRDIRTPEKKSVSADANKRKSKKKQAAGEESKADAPAGPRNRWSVIRPLLWEKVPLFALALVSSIVTYLVQEKEGAMQAWPLATRIPNAIVSYVTYLGKAILPVGLAAFYPYSHSLPFWQVFGAVFLLIAVTLTVFWKARRMPYMTVGWLWYLGTLVPVIGIVQVGLQARADRYTYVPLIGLFIMAAWGIPELLRKWRYRKEALFALSTVVLACLCVLTWKQVGYWHDSITLFNHALNVTKNNDAAYYNRGAAYSRLGDFKQALADYDKALEINPDYADAYYNRGTAYLNLDDNKKAIEDYDKAIAIKPNYERAYNNRGLAYSKLGNYQQAIEDYNKTLMLNPLQAETYNNRGYAYWRLGNDKQALEDLKRAARLGYVNAQNALRSQGMGW